jgi:hypothetical protein
MKVGTGTACHLCTNHGISDVSLPNVQAIVVTKPQNNSTTKTRTKWRQQSHIPQRTSIEVDHSFAKMMNMKLITAAAFKRKSRPATAALEESLRVDEHLTPMQRKIMRHSPEGESSSNTSSSYGISSLSREMENLEHALTFPTIEWSFDDDIKVASEGGTPSNDDECIQSRQNLNTVCVPPATLQTTSCLLSKKTTYCLLSKNA